jgi:hypothetical protein
MSDKSDEQSEWEQSLGEDGSFEQTICFPEDSIISDFVEFARTQVEGADCYIVGSALVACATILARRHWVHWGGDNSGGASDREILLEFRILKIGFSQTACGSCTGPLAGSAKRSPLA